MHTSIKDFIDIGDPNAPIGSAAWCRASHLELCAAKRQTDKEVRRLKYDLREFRDKERWKQLSNKKGRSFASWKQYVETPEPDGLGMPLESVDAVFKALDDALIGHILAKHGRPRKGEGKGSDATFIGRGTVYLRARLARDHSGILEAYERGEFDSVRAAAIAAGIVKVKSPLEELYSWWAKANPQERAAFRAKIETEPIQKIQWPTRKEWSLPRIKESWSIDDAAWEAELRRRAKIEANHPQWFTN